MDSASDIAIRVGSPTPVYVDRGGNKADARSEVRVSEDAVTLSLRAKRTTFTPDVVGRVLRSQGPLAFTTPRLEPAAEVEATYTASINGETVAKKIALDFEIGYTTVEEEESAETHDNGRTEKVLSAYGASAERAPLSGTSELAAA